MNDLSSLSNEELIRSLKSLVGDERGVVVAVLKHLTEFEHRRLAESSAFPSLFEYCVRELHYAQGEAFRRIRAARAAEKFDVLYGHIEKGELSLTTVAMLEPHLKWDNYRKLIRASKGLSTREVEALVASLNPVAAGPAERIRMLTVAPPPARVPPADELFAPPVEAGSKKEIPAAPMVSAAEASTNQAAESPIAPFAEAPKAPAAAAPPPPPAPPPQPVRRAHFSFTADEKFLRDFERAKELSRHKWPSGTQEDVFGGAIKALLDKIDPDRRRRRRERARRLAAGARSRKIPQAVKDEVWGRDGGRCVYESPGGRVCGARAGLEFDHALPWALGGGSGDARNVRLLCRAHNGLEARRAFGGTRIDAAIAGRRSQAAKDQRRLAEGGEI